MSKVSFFEELKRRHVVRVAAIYGAVAWGATEIVVTVVDKLPVPAWIATVAVIAFIVGFPITMFLSWTFDITPEGIRQTPITSRKGKISVASAAALLVLSTTGLYLLIKQPPVVDRGVAHIMPNSVAVMPFDNSTGDPADNYLVVGLGDELREQLGQVAGLQMAARSSSIAARSQALDAVAASAKLGVAVLVEGRVRRRGNDLQVSVELVDGYSGLILWTSSFSRTDHEMLSVQQSIADQILAKILPDSVETIASLPTNSSSANELILLARYYELQVRQQVGVDYTLLSKAIELYRQATELDSESALAHSRLARALMYANDFSGAEAPIFRAVTLNSELSEVQNTLGNYYLSTGVRGAGIAFRRATELNPNNADALADYAWWLWMQARDGETAALYRRALELDPLSLSRYGALADYYGYTGRVPEALEVAASVEQMFEGADSYRLIGRIMELVGELDASIAWTIRARDLEPENQEYSAVLAELYAEIGDFETALLLDPDPSIGLLFKMGSYQALIDEGEYLLIEEPDDLDLRLLLSYSYTLMQRPDLAIRLLTLASVPERGFGETRHPRDFEALIYLIDALDAAEETELAKDMAARILDRPHIENDHWWIHVYAACPLAILGRNDEALDHLARAGASTRLPWESLIRDMRCFHRYEDNLQYQEILARVSLRRADQLRRLPTTLRAFGVTL